jgi:hypothetical protein
MSRARQIPSDLHHVAQLAGTTATVVEGAALAAERAQQAADLAAEVKEQVSKASKGRSRKLLLVLVLLALAAIGVVAWKKAKAGDDQDADVTDLRTGSQAFAGSMP